MQGSGPDYEISGGGQEVGNLFKEHACFAIERECQDIGARIVVFFGQSAVSATCFVDISSFT